MSWKLVTSFFNFTGFETLTKDPSLVINRLKFNGGHVK
jgi:hypothetical protein